MGVDKLLGIIIDEKISSNEHINNLSSKLNTSLYVLKIINHTSDEATTKTTLCLNHIHTALEDEKEY